MTGLSHEPKPHVRQSASAGHADWSYERLGGLRQMAVQVRDSGFLWIHERTHVDEIIERIDATVGLKRERDACRAPSAKRGA